MSDPTRNGGAVEFCELRSELQHQVRSLILDGLREHWGSIDPALNRDLDDLAEWYKDGTTLVARLDDTVVGTGTLIRRTGTTAEIVRMSVAPASRGAGLGRRLAHDLVAIARAWGMTRVVLETSVAWTEVVQFYLRCGFELTHVENGEFGRDAWFAMHLDS